MENHSEIDDLIVFKGFNNPLDQAQWVTTEIEKNLKEDELLHKDIIVINPMALTTEKKVAQIRSLLAEKNINSHIAGKFDLDKFFKNDSITFTGINRAKGNEVPLVYIINADDCYSDLMFENLDLIKRRNILFTAITRSKAWVRVTGVGLRMQKLIKEYEEIKNRHFVLQFIYPSEDQIKKMNVIHRDITETEVLKIKQDEGVLSNVKEIVERIKNGEGHIEDYSKEVQSILKVLLENEE